MGDGGGGEWGGEVAVGEADSTSDEPQCNGHPELLGCSLIVRSFDEPQCNGYRRFEFLAGAKVT